MTGLPEIQAGPIHFEHLQYKGFSFENKCQSYKIEMRRYRHIWYYLMEVCSGRLMTAGFWAVDHPAVRRKKIPLFIQAVCF